MILYICFFKRNRLIMPKIIAQKQDWIELGYKLFSQQGISGIVIEKMAKKLTCNKSSFYWHFKTKDKFIIELVNFWVITETDQIINDTEKTATSEEKLDKFLTIAFKNDPYLEFVFFLKRYAIKKKKIQLIIDKVDLRRLDYTSQLFQKLGYSKNEAVTKATIFYKYLIGYHEMIKNKKQKPNYLTDVKKELKHFLNL